eukprot:gene4781-8367_t
MSLVSFPFLEDSGQTKYILHPLVLCSIFDFYVRRKEGKKRVLGTLVGEITQGYVEIKDCFTVPINDETEDKLEVDIDFHSNMFELHHKVHPTDVVIGWFSTGSKILPDDMIIHDFYSKNILNHPLFLLVDTINNLQVKGFVDKPILMGNTFLGIKYQRIPLEYKNLNLKLKEEEENNFDELKSKILNILNEFKEYIDKGGNNNLILKLLNDSFFELKNESPILFSKILKDYDNELNNIIEFNKVIENQVNISESIHFETFK